MDGMIAVIGSANVDFIMKVPALPRPGETVTDGAFSRANGGKGANTAVAAARAGGRVALLACLGDDLYASSLLESFKKDGIDVSRVVLVPGIATGAALITVDPKGENAIGVAPGANDRLTPERVRAAEDLIREAAVILMQMEIPPAAVQEVLRLAGSHGTPVLFNYAPVRGKPVRPVPEMSALIVNEGEAAALAGTEVTDAASAAAAARHLREYGPPAVVVTMGAAGAVVVAGEQAEHVSAFPVRAVDSTAAGDTFSGAMGTAWVEGRPLAESVRFACAAASLSVTRMGAQPSCPTRAEIDALLNQESRS